MFLWHGNVFRSLQTVDDIATDLEDEDTGGQQDKDRHDKLAKAVREFGGYLAANASAITSAALPRRRDHLHLVRGIRGQPGDQQTHGQKAADALEPRGAHLLLQIRTRVLNDTLAEDYQRWYPDFNHTPHRQDQAA